MKSKTIDLSLLKNSTEIDIGKFWKIYKNLGRDTILIAFTRPIIDRGQSPPVFYITFQFVHTF